MNRVFLDIDLIEEVFEDLFLEEIVEISNIIYENIYKTNDDKDKVSEFVLLCRTKISVKMKEYVEDLDISTICENYDVSELINENIEQSEHGPEVDMEAITETIADWVKSDVIDEILDEIKMLPTQIREELDVKKLTIHVSNSDIESILNSFFEPDYDQDEYHNHSSSYESVNEIEAIFDRD